MRNKIFVIIGSVLFIFCFVVFYQGLQKPNTYSPELKKEKKLPSFISSDFFSDEKISSETIFEKGNYYIINIWASWCIPCRDEHLYLMNLSNNKKVSIIGLNYKDNISGAKNFLNELGNPYSIILEDKDGSTAINLGAYGVPESFLIYQNQIIKKYIGPIDYKTLDEIEEIIK